MKLTRLEFWIVTAFAAFLIYNNLLSMYEPTQEYMLNVIFPGMLKILGTYFSFLLINNIIVANTLPEEKWREMGFQCVGVMILLFIVLIIADQLRPNYYAFDIPDSMLRMLPKLGWTIAIISTYIFLKNWITIKYSSNNSERNKLMTQSLWALTLWAVILLFLMTTNNGRLGPLWISAVPFGIIMYLLDRFWFLPEYRFLKGKGYQYAVRIAFMTLLCWNLSFLIKTSTSEGIYGNDIPILVYILITLFILLIALFLSRFSFNQLPNQQELKSVQTELGQSSADLQFLRSQINPHFLFNVLNTLYGTSIQENADRTSVGIQKLGDMMRFMLHENTLDSIPVAREIDYLKDYIYLQKLRLTKSELITVEVSLPENPCHHTIAPMLLIPFVENAFKHGVSLVNRSWITITMYCEDNRIDFDIHNSFHLKSETDTERFQGGIGLSNVKQRLELLYLNKYDLSIRQTKTEFFVHMTLFL